MENKNLSIGIATVDVISYDYKHDEVSLTTWVHKS